MSFDFGFGKYDKREPRDFADFDDEFDYEFSDDFDFDDDSFEEETGYLG